MEPPPLPRTIVPQRADLVKLYTNFFRTPHFAHWWKQRRRAIDVIAPSEDAAAHRTPPPSRPVDVQRTPSAELPWFGLGFALSGSGSANSPTPSSDQTPTRQPRDVS